MHTATLLLEAAVLTSALCMDTFVASFAYGSNKIKIPKLSALIISLVCSIMLGISLSIGLLIRPYIPERLTTAICFTLLFLLGIMKMMDGITKSIIKKYGTINNRVNFSLFNFSFLLCIYADPQKADKDQSKIISSSEAISLAFALSLDGIAVGFGAALGNVNSIAVFLCSLIINILAVIFGAYLGNKVATKLPFDMSWLSGAILVVLAIIKLF